MAVLTKFIKIRQLAEKRKGGKAALDDMLDAPKTARQLANISDDRYLSTMTRCIFNAGFNWKVIEHKWEGFETAFHGFNAKGLAHMSPEKWEAYVEDKRIVRNWIKIKAVLDNAHFVLAQSEESGSFGKFMGAWPESDQIGLMAYLKKNGSRLGGNTCMYFLRFMGKDGFILSRDVVARLQASGADIRDQPTSKKDLKLIQQSFNEWQQQSQLPMTQISRICSYSIGENYLPR